VSSLLRRRTCASMWCSTLDDSNNEKAEESLKSAPPGPGYEDMSHSRARDEHAHCQFRRHFVFIIY